MGSRNGYYQYHYDFVAVDENDISPKYKSNLRSGANAFLFVITTDFVVKARPGEPTPDVTLDSETFDAPIYPRGDDEKWNWAWICRMTRYRLREYWMTEQEIRSFAKKALAFASDWAKDPQYAAATLVPVLVRFEVRTMQQEGEAFDAARARAIREKKLVPLYLWDEPTVEDPPGKQISSKFKTFLMFLPRVRVESVDQCLALMDFCLVCKQKPVLGDQISSLPHCNHAFHVRCIVQELVDDIGCPRCGTPAYPYKRPRFPSVSVSRHHMLEASQCPSVMYSNMISLKSSDSEACKITGNGEKFLTLLMGYNCSKAITSVQMVAQCQIAQEEVMSSEVISLMSSEGETFKVEKAVALKSPVLKGVMESNTCSAGMSIPLPGISSKILTKVIEFMNDATMDEAKVDVKEFESKFVKDFDMRMLCNLQKIASFLCIPLLPELTNMVIIDKLNQSTLREIRKDFTLFEKYDITRANCC